MEPWQRDRLKLAGKARELTLDSNTRLCCVACKVHLAANELSVDSHVGGKKHKKLANKLSNREVNERKKRFIRSKDQDEKSDLWYISRTKTPVADAEKNIIDSKQDPTSFHLNAKLQEHSQFDKSEFINTVMRGLIGSTDSAPRTNATSVRAEFHSSSRAEGLASLEASAFRGTTFFTSMAPETPQPHLARNISQLIESYKAMKTRNDRKSQLDNDIPHHNCHHGQTVNSDNNAHCVRHYLSLYMSDDEVDLPTSNDGVEERGSNDKMPPWVIGSDSIEAITHSHDETLVLHYEILEFSRFMSPTKIEVEDRKRVCRTVRRIVKTLWPKTRVQVFGSYATGLYIPSSDIDLCVFNTPHGGTLSDLETLARVVRNLKGFARRVRVVEGRVNLVKLVSRDGNVAVDIAIGRRISLRNVALVRSYLEDYPALRPLALVIKYLLYQRGMNEAVRGGLGSYAVLLLIISHLQMLQHNYPNIEHAGNLGVVLIEFFDLYGHLFNLCCTGIAVHKNGVYYEKIERYNTMWDETFRFSLEDPNEFDNEIGRNSRESEVLRNVFIDCFELLSTWNRNDATHCVTPLCRIISMEEGFEERRKSVKQDQVRENTVEMAKYVRSTST